MHFPSQEEGGLATIRVFNRSARPASLSRLGEETETDTEGESSSTGWCGKYVGGSTFPFPRVPPTSPLNSSNQKYEIDWSQSSRIPRNHVLENVFLDSLQVVDGDETVLQGTLLIRNITYHKTVMVRYTLDDWETVNDVLGWYHLADKDKIGWDRFQFSISLAGSRQGLEKRVMWLVAKYAGADGQGADVVEWWDNNEGKNYRVGFKKAEEKVYKRGVVVSAPATPTRPKLSAPQISPSVSFPFSGQQYQERAQYQAGVAQSTLARLKRLTLKNYVAPRGYTYGNPPPPPPVLTLTQPSPTTSAFVDTSSPSESSPISPTSPTLSADLTSTDSTPVQTPTQDDKEPAERWKMGGRGEEEEEEEEKLSWSLCMESGHFVTTLDTLPTTTTTPLASPPIPVSIPGGGGHGYPYPSKSEMGTSPPFSDLGGSVYWDWGTAAGIALGEKGKEHRKESSSTTTTTATSVTGGGGGGLTPPHRKRVLLHAQTQQKRGSGTTSSESGSNSNPSSPPAPSSTATSTTTSPPPKAKPTPPKLNLPTSPPLPFTTATEISSPTNVQSPYPRRGAVAAAQIYGHHRHHQPMSPPPSPPSFSMGISSPPPTPGDSSSDAIYQALVREWCFAKGPSASGEITPIVVAPAVKSQSPLGRELICE